MNAYKMAVLCGLASVPAMAQFTYPGCANLQNTDFQSVELFNKTGTNSALATHAGLVEPVQFDVQGVYNTAGDSVLYTNIYFVERKGKVKFYDGLARRVDSIGYIPNWGYQSNNNANDNGLMGLALDPNFSTNRWIYFWYCPTIPGAPATGATSSANRRLRLSRITVNGQNRLDMGSEKILIDILGSKTDQYHSGGPMAFDRYGDLWVAVGNNSNDLSGSGNQYSTTDSNGSGEWGSSNTASLRGGVFRIHPDNNATASFTNRSGSYGPGYTVPAGNFGEYWAQQFDGQGNTALAAQYRDTARVRPEVYVKGTRSNYSIAVHPTKGWLGWGDVNYSTTNDEYNLVTRPVFAGMPYFHSNNQATPSGSVVLPTGHSAATPINASPLNSGVRNLPPAAAPLIWNASASTINTLPNNVAISGPFYAYDRNLKSAIKFPPHLSNSWILMTCYGSPANGNMWMVMLDSVNSTPTLTGVPQQQGTTGLVRFGIRNPIHAKYGPDGALYVLNYGSTGAYGSGNNPGVIRVSYTGSCALPATGVANKPAPRFNISLTSQGLLVRESGTHEFGLYAVNGDLLLKNTGTQGAAYSFPKLREELRLQKGVYIVRVKTEGGLFTRNVSLF